MAATKKSSTKPRSAGKSGAARGTTPGTTPGRSSGKRELIDTGTDKRYVRRDAQGQFKESDDVSRSLSVDRRRAAKTPAKKGQGDRGDRKRS
jgi:hypothetical protein